MSSFDGTELREIYLSVPSYRKRWEGLLAKTDLVPEEGIPDYVVGVFDQNDSLIGTASLDGHIVKYVAIDPDHQGEAIANRLLSAIISRASEEGSPELTIFTKPEYAMLFTALSFSVIGRSDSAVMLENSGSSLASYKRYLTEERATASGRTGENAKDEIHQIFVHAPSYTDGDKTGVIVMNANPPSIGHLHLIRQSTSKVDRLFVIPLADNPATEFSYRSRRDSLIRSTSDLTNVTVLEGSRYCISAETFPSYFIKEIGRRADSHIRLDLDIFIRHIAPSLGATVRFVGEEPTDKLTARYNELMKELLPVCGIEVVEIPRLSGPDENPVSASIVRKLIKNGNLREVLTLVPMGSVPAVMAKAAAAALHRELDLTPKPGLVDKANSGSHSDMNYPLMVRSIVALEPIFEELASESMTDECPSSSVLQPIGKRGEAEMMKATGGVNTHRGALFSLGLIISAATWLLYKGRENVEEAISRLPETLPETVSRIASTFRRPLGTHGSQVAEEYGIPTAIDIAAGGFEDSFGDWRRVGNDHLRLLSIMAELDDSNVYHRGGREGSTFIKSRSRGILDRYKGARNLDSASLIDDLRKFDREAIVRNLSPGGAADMLALTFFLDSLLGIRFSPLREGEIPEGNNPKL